MAVIACVCSSLRRGAMRHSASPSFAAVRYLVLASLVVVAAPSSSPPPPLPPPGGCNNTINGVVHPGNSYYVAGLFNISGCGNVIGTSLFIITKATVIGSNNVLGGTQAASQATNNYAVRVCRVPHHTTGDAFFTALHPPGLWEQ